MKILPIALLLTAVPALAEPLPDGRYRASDSQTALELRIKGARASVLTSSDTCIGEVTGQLAPVGPGAWHITAPAAPGETCRIRIDRAADGTLTLHEEMGCGYWHGLSCSFDGALR